MGTIFSVVTYLEGGFLDDAMAEARGWCDEALLFDDDRIGDELGQICGHLAGDLSPLALGTLSLMGGMLVERGADPARLGEAMLPPLSRTLVAAARLLDLVVRFPNSKEAQFFVGRRGVSRKSRKAIQHQDGAALEAYRSLDRWSSPFAAVFSRRPGDLVSLRERADIAGPLARLHDSSEGAACMHQLLHTPRNEPLVVLAPGLEEGCRFEVSGCVSVGQLTVLLSEPMASIFERLGAGGCASAEMLDNARGVGPQQIDDAYQASVHLYSWMAVDPATGEPAPGRHTWVAPGGRGDHSLPPDHLLADLPLLDGERVLMAVGPDPRPEGVNFTRVLGGVRTFDALRAELRPLGFDRAEARRWLDRARQAAAALPSG